MLDRLVHPTRLLGATRAAVGRLASATWGGASEVAGAAVGAAAAGTARFVSEATLVPARALVAAGSAASRARDSADTLRREAVPATGSLTDLHPDRSHRRVWSGHGRAHIEVRGMSGSGATHRRLAGGVRRQLGKLRGVRWAEVNAVTGQVLVAFDQRRVGVGTLLDVVRDVEQANGTREGTFSWSTPLHPSDGTPIAAATVELAADCMAVTTAILGRVTRLPALPRAMRLVPALMEIERPLRRRLKRRIGPVGTDVVLALTAAAVQGLSHGPAMPAVDALYRLELLGEALSRRLVWERREEELCCTASHLPSEAPERPPRPEPRPEGPIETWARRLGPGTLGAAGAVLALTRNPGRAADTILAAVPKAARLGREGFATTLGRGLARQGVVPLNAGAWRRLDRVSAIVVDSRVLCGSRPHILAADPARGVDTAEIWRLARRALADRGMDDLRAGGPWNTDDLRLEADGHAKSSNADGAGAVRLKVRQGKRVVGRVTVGSELEPLADAVLDAARSSGARTLLTRHASVRELLPRADEVLDDDVTLADHVLRLQADGHAVLVVSGVDDRALALADVGIARLGAQECVCWSADVLCGPGLASIWRILQAVGAARPVSERAVTLAQAGSALGALIALVGRRRRGNSPVTTPVYLAALAALVQGTVAGRAVVRRAPPPPVTHVPWHAFDAPDVLARLAADAEPAADLAARDGWPATLSHVSDTAGRISRTPPVSVLLAPPRTALALTGAMKEELRDPLTPVLAVGAVASAIVGSSLDALLVGAVLGGNAFISGAQRISAERAIRKLFLRQEVSAQRLHFPTGKRPADGIDDLESVPVKAVPGKALRPGDVIALTPSSVVPADARLLSAADLEVDESTLTGESMPVQKDIEPTPAAPLAERSCMVFEGTTVLAGSGYAVVVAAGDATEAGRATRAAGRAGAPAGLQARLSEVTRIALPATGIGGAAVGGLGLIRGLPLRQAVAAGVSVAVAAVPEGLPLVATVAQAAAARRLSGQEVLVRSSRTLEALGRVDVICFDKTGTLTEGRLDVARLASVKSDLEPEDAAARHMLRTAARTAPTVNGNIDAAPHAEDRAVLEAADRMSAEQPDRNYRKGWQRTSELPFETSRGYAAALGTDEGKPHLAVKGAPEVVLGLCSRVATKSSAGSLTDAKRRAAQVTVDRLAADGLRVLAVAERRAGLPKHAGSVEDLVTDLTLLGFVGVADTYRDAAPDAVRRLGEEDVTAVMVTGDHPTTAAAIARAVGMPADNVLTGADLDEMTESERIKRVAETTVFARVSPEQKLRIVEALRAGGHVVAMTGDGTNDAAAIRLADVGIAVSSTGASSATSAADIVLTDASMQRIHDALLEGRGLWHRVGDAVSILVGGNAGEVAFMVLGTALAGRAPINVRQLLVVNLLTDMFPALAVAVAGGQNGADPAVPPAERLGAPLARSIAIRGAATALGALLAWGVGRFTGRRARAGSMGLAALVGTQLGQTLLTAWRSPLVVATAAASAVVLFLIIETPGVSQFFGCTPLGPVAWAVAFAAAVAGTLAAAMGGRLAPSV